MSGPRITPRHWIVLFFACFLMFGNYYSYDTPGSINTQLRQWLGSSDKAFQWQLNFLYSVYSLPNIFLPLVGGILVDRLGPASMLSLFSTLICLGQILFALGMSLKSFGLMAAGRLVFGFGGESLEVAQASITTDWFQGRGLAFALGLNISFARIAAALNDNLSPILANMASVPAAGWMGVLACILSSVSAIFLIFLDSKDSRKTCGVYITEEEEPLLNDEQKESESIQDLGIPIHVENPSPNLDAEVIRNPVNIGLPSQNDDLAQFLLKPGEAHGVDNSHGEDDESSYDSEEYEEEDEIPHITQFAGISLPFWLLFINTIALYGSVQPFFHVCTDFFQDKWYHNDPQQAGFVMSIPDLISAVGTPLVGLFVDRYGHRTLLISLSGASVFLSLFMMTYTTISPAISMSVLGVSYSAFTSSLWPCVPFLVERHQMATAYGLLSVALNITLFTVPLIIAKLRGMYPNDWIVTMRFFLTFSAISIGFSLLLYIVDLRRGGTLSQGSKTKKYASSSTTDEGTRLLGGRAEREDETDSVSEEENLVAKVVRDGVVVAVPHTVIYHHHHIPHHHHNQTQDQSRKSDHIHTTHCTCFQSQSRSRHPVSCSTSSATRSIPGRHGRSPLRRSSPVKRSRADATQSSPNPFSPQPDTISLANSI